MSNFHSIIYGYPCWTVDKTVAAWTNFNCNTMYRINYIPRKLSRLTCMALGIRQFD